MGPMFLIILRKYFVSNKTFIDPEVGAIIDVIRFVTLDGYL